MDLVFAVLYLVGIQVVWIINSNRKYDKKNYNKKKKKTILIIFIDVCYDHVKFTGYHTGYHDTLAVVDLQTYRKIPWENDILQY